MNKSTKGALATGAAVVLLTGGAGTLAYWNAEADVDGGRIASGEMSLTPVAGAAWRLNGTTVPDPEQVVLVPGDELVYTGSYTVGATGDNLQGTVSVTGADRSLDDTIGDAVTTTLSYTLDGVASAGTIDEGDDDEVLAVRLVASFPFGSGVDNTSQRKVLDLTDVSVALTQTDASPVP